MHSEGSWTSLGWKSLLGILLSCGYHMRLHMHGILPHHQITMLWMEDTLGPPSVMWVSHVYHMIIT